MSSPVPRKARKKALEIFYHFFLGHSVVFLVENFSIFQKN
jgi:hypothetical protein